MATLSVEFKPHWINGGWLRTFTDPYAAVDGEVHRCSWREKTTIESTPGPHDVRTFVRYRKFLTQDLGVGAIRVEVPENGVVAIRTSNSFNNGSPFTPRIQPN